MQLNGKRGRQAEENERKSTSSPGAPSTGIIQRNRLHSFAFPFKHNCTMRFFFWESTAKLASQGEREWHALTRFRRESGRNIKTRVKNESRVFFSQHCEEVLKGLEFLGQAECAHRCTSISIAEFLSYDQTKVPSFSETRVCAFAYCRANLVT